MRLKSREFLFAVAFLGASSAGAWAQGNLSGNPVPLPGRAPESGGYTPNQAPPSAPYGQAPQEGNLSGDPVPMPGRGGAPGYGSSYGAGQGGAPSGAYGAPPTNGNLSGNPVPMPGRGSNNQ